MAIDGFWIELLIFNPLFKNFNMPLWGTYVLLCACMRVCVLCVCVFLY